jgi:hypothetical protein
MQYEKSASFDWKAASVVELPERKRVVMNDSGDGGGYEITSTSYCIIASINSVRRRGKEPAPDFRRLTVPCHVE